LKPSAENAVAAGERSERAAHRQACGDQQRAVVNSKRHDTGRAKKSQDADASVGG